MSKYRNLSEKAYKRGYQIGRLELKGRVSENSIRDWRHTWHNRGYGAAFDAGRSTPVLRDNISFESAFWTPAQQRYWRWKQTLAVKVEK